MTDAPSISFEEFKSRLQAGGFNPDETRLKEMYAALPHLEGLRTQIRRNYAHADEPAHVFSPLEPKP